MSKIGKSETHTIGEVNSCIPTGSSSEELWSILEKVTEILYSSLKLEIFQSGFHGIPIILFKLWGF
jgi:hypothetical protein